MSNKHRRIVDVGRSRPGGRCLEPPSTMGRSQGGRVSVEVKPMVRAQTNEYLGSYSPASGPVGVTKAATKLPAFIRVRSVDRTGESSMTRGTYNRIFGLHRSTTALLCCSPPTWRWPCPKFSLQLAQRPTRHGRGLATCSRNTRRIAGQRGRSKRLTPWEVWKQIFRGAFYYPRKAVMLVATGGQGHESTDDRLRIPD